MWSIKGCLPSQPFKTTKKQINQNIKSNFVNVCKLAVYGWKT